MHSAKQNFNQSPFNQYHNILLSNKSSDNISIQHDSTPYGSVFKLATEVLQCHVKLHRVTDHTRVAKFLKNFNRILLRNKNTNKKNKTLKLIKQRQMKTNKSSFKKIQIHKKVCKKRLFLALNFIFKFMFFDD